MKKVFTKPGFEFMFSISLFVIFALPLLVFAKATKSVEIKITNGDSIMEGKKIKEFSFPEQQRVKTISYLANHPPIAFRRSGMADTVANQLIIEEHRFNEEIALQPTSSNDSAECILNH
ncbi:MAG: hypothetical protein ABI203_04625 [Mucilaginibacter sp.]